MKIRAILRFKNENFRAVRIAAGFLTMKSLAEETRIPASLLSEYENFKRYPNDGTVKGKGSRRSWHIEILEKTLKTPIDDLFPSIYKQAVDQKRGKPIERIAEIRELPEWAYGPSNYLPSPEDEYETEIDIKNVINSAMEDLTEHERLILEDHFGLNGNEEYTLREMADKFKISPERIRQIEAKALRKLESFSKRGKLRSFLSDSQF